MKILITGIAGFIGSQIANSAIKKGYSIIGVDDLSQGYKKNVPAQCEFLEYDLVTPKNIQKFPKDIDVILHLAGQSSGEISFDNPVADLEKNCVSTLNLIKYGIDIGAKKFVYASSMSVYGATPDQAISEDFACDPISCYGTGKYAAENYLKIYRRELPFIAFRMFNVYGPGQDLSNLRQGMVSIYIAHILKNGHLPIKGNLQRFRDFIYIDDVVKIWLQAIADNDIKNEVFNLGTGIRTTVFDLVTTIKKIIPYFTWTELGSTPGDQFGIYADMKKAEAFFGNSHFVSLEEGLRVFIEWSKENLKH